MEVGFMLRIHKVKTEYKNFGDLGLKRVAQTGSFAGTSNELSIAVKNNAK